MRAPSLLCLQALRAIAGPEACRPGIFYCLQAAHASSSSKAKSSPTPPSNTTGSPAPPSKPAPLQYTPPPTPLQYTPPAPPTSDNPIPQPLRQPLGLPYAPQPGDNTGLDARTLRQRRDDLVDYDKHLVRRKTMTTQIARPYFKDFSDMRFSKGKTFLAPERIFKAAHALFFPNLRGRTLEKREGVDTTGVLRGKVSVVAVFSSDWAEGQTRTFVGREQHGELHDVLDKEAGGLAQLVEINVEQNALKYWILRLVEGRIRGLRNKASWGKYFVVRRGVSQEIRDALAIVNQRVGYVYLLDQACRIRWAGSALADEEEKQTLVRGINRLLQEARPGKAIRVEQDRADSLMEGEDVLEEEKQA